MKVGISTSSFGKADPAPVHRLRDAGIEVVPNPFGRRLTRDEASAFVQDLDGLIAGLEPLDRDVLSHASSLRALARVGIGMDNVDQVAARDLGISVSNTPDPPTAAVAELTLTAMLALVRGFVPFQASLRAGDWVKEIRGSLSGATVGVVGLGRIGRRVVELIQPFGARVIGIDPFIPEDVEVPGVSERRTLEDALPDAEVLTLHASGSDVLIGAGEIDSLPAGSIILNAARGTLVDEAALGEALKSGQISAAWFDAFWEEPYEGDLRSLDNFYGTPHVGTYTARCRREMEMEAVKNILKDLGITQFA